MGTTPEVRDHLSVVVALNRILLFDSVIVLGSVGSSSVDGSLAGGLEFFESLLEEGSGVFAGATTFHVGGDVGPEAGGAGIFDFLLGEEQALVLLIG